MESRKYYWDVMLVPLRLLITLAYHVWLWHKILTQPFTTILGIDADGRSFWVPGMMEDVEKEEHNSGANTSKCDNGVNLVATTFILLCAGVGAVISSTYSIKKPIKDTVYGANGEIMVAIKYISLLAIFFSFVAHTLSIRFLNQINVLISTPKEAMSMMTPEYLTGLLQKANVLNTVGNRLFFVGLPLLLWIFGPLKWLSCVV